VIETEIQFNEKALDELADRIAARIKPDQTVFRPGEAAEWLRVSRAHLYNLLTTRQLRSFKLGKSRRVRRQDIDEYIKTQLAESAKD